MVSILEGKYFLLLAILLLLDSNKIYNQIGLE